MVLALSELIGQPLGGPPISSRRRRRQNKPRVAILRPLVKGRQCGREDRDAPTSSSPTVPVFSSLSFCQLVFQGTFLEARLNYQPSPVSCPPLPI
ncbi:hypothetical protein EV363DRAFT_1399650 [Boletus edulis]|uniref:Uncharacterized protein n=1 Tax=Boletus edulis BED1 TaxID=1328754 RepID=A0AAD4GCM2_BOLED|nr:hypothetical protein EV363DRAFT_1399650 [Boletus edulis]KAF8435472.1 hypothetical protein L210DRAFT_363783 [Boletus edulis BED1]